jgi:hypothetical protein
MKNYIKEIVILLALSLILLLVFFRVNSFGANVTDNNSGNSGYILINTGTGQGHRGTWINPDTWTPIVDLNNSLTTETNNRINADIAEIEARVSGDNVLQNNINTETSNRILADKKLKNKINKVNKESIVRDNVLQQNINNETNERIMGDNNLNQRINNQQGQIDNLGNRVNKLYETQYNIEGVIRILDTKKTITEIYSTYDVRHSRQVAIGLRFTYKLGKSYLEKENDKINARLDKIEKQLGNTTIIEKTLDNRGKVRSMRISDGQLVIEGKY